RPSGSLLRCRPPLPGVCRGTGGVVLPVAALPDRTATDRPASPAPWRPDARRRPRGVALPRGVAAGVERVAGAVDARGANFADAGRRPGRDAAPAAGGAQQHGPPRPRGARPASL